MEIYGSKLTLLSYCSFVTTCINDIVNFRSPWRISDLITSSRKLASDLFRSSVKTKNPSKIEYNHFNYMYLFLKFKEKRLHDIRFDLRMERMIVFVMHELWFSLIFFYRIDVISCLSEHVRNDTLLEEKHRIDKVCRKQLRAEVLERVRFHYLILLYFYVNTCILIWKTQWHRLVWLFSKCYVSFS